jgi:dihydroxy-acid dehydratase
VGPEAAVGGPIALIQDGDMITLNADTGELSVALSDTDLAARRQAWQPKAPNIGSGTLWRYAQNVGNALTGALTHPGAKGEIRGYWEV